jgi:hypothetical protein
MGKKWTTTKKIPKSKRIDMGKKKAGFRLRTNMTAKKARPLRIVKKKLSCIAWGMIHQDHHESASTISESSVFFHVLEDTSQSLF